MGAVKVGKVVNYGYKSFRASRQAAAASKFVNKVGRFAGSFFRKQAKTSSPALKTALKTKAVQTSQVTKGVGEQIWTKGGAQSSVKNAYKHWKAHGKEFSNIQNSKQYVEAARALLKDPKALSMIRPADGCLLKYNINTNSFGSYTPGGIPKTFFKPNPFKHKYPSNLEYFYGQR